MPGTVGRPRFAKRPRQLDRFTIRRESVSMALGGLPFGWLLGQGLIADVHPRGRLAYGVTLLLLLIAQSAIAVVNHLATKPTTRQTNPYAESVMTGGWQLASGQVAPGPTIPGRTVHLCRTLLRPAGILGQFERPTDLIAVMEVLPPDAPPRRIGVPTPCPEQLVQKGTVHAVALHPDNPDAAVLDGRASAELRHAFAHDPRWQTETFPTDLSLRGGVMGIVALALLDLLAIGTTLGLCHLLVFVFNLGIAA